MASRRISLWLSKYGPVTSTVVFWFLLLNRQQLSIIFSPKQSKRTIKQCAYTDSEHTEYNYLIEQQSHALYRIKSLTFSDGLAAKQPTFTKTKITLPNGFYHVKIDDDFLYYASDEKGSTYLNAISLSNIFIFKYR